MTDLYSHLERMLSTNSLGNEYQLCISFHCVLFVLFFHLFEGVDNLAPNYTMIITCFTKINKLWPSISDKWMGGSELEL